MENRVVRILPTLMDEAVLRLAAIFDEAVAIQVAIAIDPGERALDVWPDSFH